MTGETREVRITMSDGVELAATLYLPDTTEPQPCLLEALPYRKDDLTSSYAESYESLRDRHGYAVCRVDLRGTGSSGGDAHDEYPPVEQTDLSTVIAWLADQEWCDGGVGMWGTSYSGFNSLQLACERPPALKAICAIYASDDRWTDDVHWRGGALKLLDLVDYCHYMTPMAQLPPVPEVYGDAWRAEWLRRLEVQQPWLLTWLRETRDGAYWRGGSVRVRPGSDAGYDRIDCAVMLVTGWADGYSNIAFRTVEALQRLGVPHRLLAGPWAHADATTAMPGPRLDLEAEMVAWWDHWLRGRGSHTDRVDVFVRTSTRPEPVLDLHHGWWLRDTWPSPHSVTETRALPGPRTLVVDPDVGTAAWIDCAGHPPWGLPLDQREDDARSLTWDWDARGETVVGEPRVRLRISADAPAASVSVKLCDVFPDGTSELVTRGSLDLAFRDGVHQAPAPLEPGRVYDVELVLDGIAHAADPGHRWRVSLAGTDWPTTVAPPAPVTLTVHDAELELPLWDGPREHPGFAPGHEHTAEDPTGIDCTVTRDVLRHTTTCAVRHGATYAVPHDGTATESYAGSVTVDRRSFAQHAEAECAYTLTWPGVEVRTEATLRVDVGPEAYEVRVTTAAYEGEEQVHTHTWTETVPRHGDRVPAAPGSSG